MKNIVFKSFILIAAFSFSCGTIHAQVINWKGISHQHRHLLHANAGAEYGLIAGLGYHHLLFIKNYPLWIGAEFSLPAGSSVGDDNKLRLGAQWRAAACHNLQFSVRIQGIIRRYHNQSVTLLNIGSDLAATLGYYRKNWFAGAELGFDKAIVTHFKHSEWYRSNIYDTVQDGWYEPPTGGNFYMGCQGGYSFEKTDITIKAGKALQQDFKSQPLLPFYGQLGINYRF